MAENKIYFKDIDRSDLPFIKRFLYIEHGVKDEIQFVPIREAALVFYLNSKVTVVEPRKQSNPPIMLAPVVDSTIRYIAEGGCRYVVLQCSPSVLSRILKINMSWDNKKTLDIPIEDERITIAYNKILLSNSFDDILNIMLSLMQQFYPSSYKKDQIDCVCEVLASSSLSFDESIKNFKLSQRTLQRQFKKRVGISPIKYYNLCRFNKLWQESLNTPGKVDWHTLIFNSGLSDQSHLIREFKKYSQKTPIQLININSAFPKAFAGKN